MVFHKKSGSKSVCFSGLDFVGLLICNVFTLKLCRDTEALYIYFVVAHSVLNVQIKLCRASNESFVGFFQPYQYTDTVADSVQMFRLFL